MSFFFISRPSILGASRFFESTTTQKTGGGEGGRGEGPTQNALLGEEICIRSVRYVVFFFFAWCMAIDRRGLFF